MSRTRGRLSAGLRSDRAAPSGSSPLDKASGVEVVWPQVAALFDAARRLGKPEFVYFIGEGDAGSIKIGLSRDPIKRLRGMQTGNSRPLKIEYVLIGNGWLEKRLHGIWEKFAIAAPRRQGKVQAAPGTEWFVKEIREELVPVVEASARRQADLAGDCDIEMLLQAVLDCHAEHGISVAGPERVRQLRGGSGYAEPALARLR